jgi:hypothetical protein
MIKDKNRTAAVVEDDLNNTTIWTTKRVEELLEKMDDGAKVKDTPFWDNDFHWRAADILYQYTPEEIEEIKRCKTDIIYFANKYCHTMTDDGVVQIQLRDYQRDVLRDLYENRFCVWLSPRQIGKTILTGIFLTHYLLFNTDRNTMVLSNNGGTTQEIIDKIKTIMIHLPFFLKPGIRKNDVMTMKFDNGCRLMGKTTTKTSGLGMTVHLLYCDEFAHLPANFIEPFWRSAYPTLSSSKISRIVITSTPNGMNKFYYIYRDALEGKNSFKPIRVDWWQVPGRDNGEWKKREIANLGSEEAFNQEYGLQFLSSSKLLLDHKTLEKMFRQTVEYKWREIEQLEDALAGTTIAYKELKWHPKFDIDGIKETDRFVVIVDTAGGVGRDYTVFNIFKLIPMPVPYIEAMPAFIDETDFVSLLQVGLFRTNKMPPDEARPILETIVYEILGSEKTSIAIESDFKGELLYNLMTAHESFYEELFIHTKHTENSKVKKPGIKLNPKNKMEFCLTMRSSMKNGKIIVNEKTTATEIQAFGIGEKGGYQSQIGHDDIAMTIVHTSPYFTSDQFYEHAGDVLSAAPQKYKDAIAKRINSDDGSEDGYSYLRDL